MAIAGIPSPGVCAYPTGSASRRSARRRVDGVGIEIGDAAQGSVLDVGEGGLRVKAADPSAFDAGTLVCFPLPEGAVIKANCEVVWANAEGVAGLRFLAFSDNSKAKLSAWLAGRASEAAARPEPVAAAVAAVAAEEPRATAIPAAEASWSTEADEPGLSKLIRSMMLMTAADGAAIALRVGDGIVCRARAGNAPQLGVKLNPDAGLSGRCLRDGEPVLCRDSESDPAVNAEACRALRLRAALLVPVKHEGQVEGVLEVFSSKPDVFDIGDIAALQRLSEKIVEYLPRPEPAIEVSAPEAEALVPTEAVPA